MRYVMRTILPAALFSLLLLPGIFTQSASASPSPLDTDGGFPVDFMHSDMREKECVETCSIQDEYYGDEMEDEGQYEEQYEDEYDDGGGEYGDEAEEEYDDQYGDEDFQEEAYPEEE